LYHDTIPKGLRFTILHRAIRQKMDESVKDFDLTGVQFAVLGQLARLEHSRSGEVSQKMLEEATHGTHANMTEILKKLEKKSFITCQPSEIDRRSKVIRSTKRAYALHSRLNECDEDIFRTLTAGIPEQEVDTMLRVMDQMLQNVFSLSGGCCCTTTGGEEL